MQLQLAELSAMGILILSLFLPYFVFKSHVQGKCFTFRLKS